MPSARGPPYDFKPRVMLSRIQTGVATVQAKTREDSEEAPQIDNPPAPRNETQTGVTMIRSGSDSKWICKHSRSSERIQRA
jgi:hypothetical protein